MDQMDATYGQTKVVAVMGGITKNGTTKHCVPHDMMQ